MNGKKKFKFNIIDAIIVLVLIAAVAVLAYVFVFSDESDVKGEECTVRYTVEFTSINDDFAEAIKEKDRVTFETDRKLDLGRVVSVDYGNSVKTGFNNVTGEEEYTAVEGLIDIVVTFEVTAEKTEWGYCIDDEAYITVNNSNEFIIGSFRGVGICTAVEVIDE